MKAVLVALPISIFMSAGAVAQQQTPPAQSSPAQSPPAQAAPAPAAPSADVSDRDVDRFALAVIAVQQIAEDQAMANDQKQQAMASAVQQAGLEPQRFNEIAVASQNDVELQRRIQIAANAHLQTGQSNQ